MTNKTVSRYIAVTCPVCNETLISRAHYDFNHCSCVESGTFIDGDTFVNPTGQLDGYYRLGGGKQTEDGQWIPPKTHFVDLPASRKEIYDDYNHKKNKWKIINTKKYPLIDIPKES